MAFGGAAGQPASTLGVKPAGLASASAQAERLATSRFPSMYAMWVVISPTSGRRMRWDSL